MNKNKNIEKFNLTYFKNKRVAIIGNMNNTGFSILRYFRNLGIDAYLLLYQGDASGGNVHFNISADTWSIESWKPYIKTLNIENSSRILSGCNKNSKFRLSKSYLRRELEGYDFYIGSGIAPAIFKKANLTLDIFFPYGCGIEFYGDVELVRSSKKNIFKKLVFKYLQYMQRKGIINTHYCLNAEMGITNDSFMKIGKACNALPIPAIFLETPDNSEVKQTMQQRLALLKSFDFTVFCHSSHLWVNKNGYNKKEWVAFSKNTDWLIRGFDEFIRSTPHPSAMLFLVEYGPDVQSSKDLIDDLALSSRVQWLPKLERKELLLLLKHADVTTGEFYKQEGCIWGGTGWEALAVGKPLLQSVNFTEDSFKNIFEHPLPPILDVKLVDDVAMHLRDMYEHPTKRENIGKQCREWFQEYNGYNLAKQWLALLQNDISLDAELIK